MKYYSEEELKKIIPIHYWRQVLLQTHLINVRFCRDCPSFVKDKYPSTLRGWCKELSFLLGRAEGMRIYMKDDDFCNEDNLYE